MDQPIPAYKGNEPFVSLIISLCMLACVGFLVLNVLRLGLAWPFIAAVGGLLAFMGYGNYLFLMYEMHRVKDV